MIDIDITLLAGNLSRLSYWFYTVLEWRLIQLDWQESASQNQVFAACFIKVEVGISMEDTIAFMVGFHLFVTDSAQLVLWGSGWGVVSLPISDLSALGLEAGPMQTWGSTDSSCCQHKIPSFQSLKMFKAQHHFDAPSQIL